MWNSLGSFRERVREHAKSAAQVAQGVLKAAAAEDDYPEQTNETEQTENWDGWGTSNQNEYNKQTTTTPQQQLSAADPLPPPLHDAPPPPPPEDSFVSAKPPVLNAAPRARRASRYVVTGVATSQPAAAAPAVPTPSVFTPRPPAISSQPEAEDVPDEAEQQSASPHAERKPPEDHTLDSRGDASEMPPGPPEDPSVGKNTEQTQEASFEPPPAVGEVTFNDDAISGPPADDAFVGWSVPVEPENDQSASTRQAGDAFASWGIDGPAAESEQTQPASLPVPSPRHDQASWDEADTTLERQTYHENDVPRTEDSFSEWDVPEQPPEATVQKDDDGSVAPPEDTFSGWEVPKEPLQAQHGDFPTQITESHASQDVEPDLPESDKVEISGQESFTDWTVTESTPLESAGAPSTSQAEEQPVENPFAGWGDPRDTSKPQETKATDAPPASDMFVGWNIPSSTNETNAVQNSEALQEANDFDGWDIQESAAEESTEPNSADVTNPATDASPEPERFTDWNVQENTKQEQRDVSTTKSANNDTSVEWNAPQVFTVQQSNQSEQNSLTPQTQPNENENFAEPGSEEAFADWGAADSGWITGGSGTQVADNGVDWFSNGATNSGFGNAPDRSPSEAVTAAFEPLKGNEDDQYDNVADSCPAPPSQLSLPSVAKAESVKIESTQRESSPAVDDEFVQKENDDKQKSKLETSTQIPNVAPQQDSNGWSFFGTESAFQNDVGVTLSSPADAQWNLAPSHESAVQDQTSTNSPIASAKAWFSNYGVTDNEPALPIDHASQANATSVGEQEPPEPKVTNMALEELHEQIRTLRLERDSAVTGQEIIERERNDLRQSIALLEGDLVQSREESEYLVAQRDAVQKERDRALEHRLEIEKERDEAIQRGGAGLREARNVIEAMRNNQDDTENREAVITEQIESLRTDLDRISQERNTLLREAEDLRTTLRDVESQSQQRDDDLRQRLQIAEHECEIARLEREKALEMNKLHADEKQRLVDADNGRAAALAESENKVIELEDYIASMQTDREDESLRIELFSKQIEEMKDRTQGVIDERNRLHDDKRNLEEEIEEHKKNENTHKRILHNAKREAASLVSERDEARQRFTSLKEQQKELTQRIDSLALERDQLVKARTAATSNSSSVSEKERALTVECEQKTRAVATLQKKLAAAVARTEKVSSQRGTFQRQRDEAGARLRAAGVEFVALNAKLEEVAQVKTMLQNQLVQIRDERDSALTRVEELVALESQVKITQDNLESRTTEVEDLHVKLKDSLQQVTAEQESNSALQQRVGSVTTDLSELRGKLEVVSREKSLVQKQRNDLEQEKTSLQQIISNREEEAKQLSKQLKATEVESTTHKEKARVDLSIAKAELESERKLHQDMKMKVAELHHETATHISAVDQIRSILLPVLNRVRSEAVRGTGLVGLELQQSVDNLLASEETATAVPIVEMISTHSNLSLQLIRNGLDSVEENESLQRKCKQSAKMISALEAEKSELQTDSFEVESLKTQLAEVNSNRDALQAEKVNMEAVIGCLREQAENAATKTAEVEAQLETMTHEMQEELRRRLDVSVEEKERLLQEADKVTSNLNSIWSMLQRSLGEEQLELLYQELSEYDESGENVAVLALRATASIVAEVSRTRSNIDETRGKLMNAEAEVSRLIDRAEIAEQERDTAKGANERLERKLKNAQEDGRKEAESHYDGIVAQLEDELMDARQELSSVSDKANRSGNETTELRALCSKLTSQFNGRTNELDEAEEKIVYLQDQVTTLEEDLEEAHTRLKKLDEESTEARNSDVKRLTFKLEEATTQLEEIEKECARLREANDEAENIAKESRLLADTHRQAEENLQIAIEQLEAAQESALEQRTIELQKKLENSEEKCKLATEREAAATVTQKQLNVRDEEIKELRGALGRLADERVELKLELEKSLSRLNHPDAGGQLVDRRVVRQLLISYFRVGSVRRRDVLELMSRMLAFTDSDNIAVGLKRRAFMDRLGSLVQPPELDDASLPPLGTVSDKWIEFLMKETEEGEEQGKAW